MKRTLRVGVVGVAFVLTASAPRAVAIQKGDTAQRADFTGEWKLNAELTERPSRPQEGGFTRGRSGGAGGGGIQLPGGLGGMGGGRRGPGGGGGGLGEGGDSRPNPEDMARVREGIRLATLIPDRLTIVRADNGFIVTDDDGVSHKLIPDGKTAKSESGAVKIETKVKWDEAVLVVERKFEGGVKATDRYWVTESPRQLVIATKVEGQRMTGDRARGHQRVYDLATASPQ
jgi:hypothetical protein